MRWRSFAALLIAFMASTVSRADVGQTTALTLLRNVGARPTGLGEAYVAVGGDIDTVGFNPAGLAALPFPTLSSTYLRGFFEDSFGFVTYAHPVPFGAVHIGASYFDAGSIDVNQSDGTQDTRSAERDIVGMLGVAVGKTSALSVGLTAKVLRLELAQEAKATGYAFDVGSRWRTPIPGLALGGAVQNLGPNVKFEEQGDPLPKVIRGGISYLLDLEKLHMLKQFPYQFLVVLDGVREKDERPGTRAGLEIKRRANFFDSSGYVAFRGGYASDTKSTNLGAGAQIKNLGIDYSIRLITDLSPAHRFTVSYRFGKLEE